MAINHDTLAKAVFAKETESATHQACRWNPPVEMQLGDMLYADGFLEVMDADGLASLPAPWSLLQAREVMLEIKMPGDHCGVEEFQRAVLRRAARDVEAFSPDSGLDPNHEPLWFVVPHIPKWLGKTYTLTKLAAGCYRVDPWPYPIFWIVANQLPLHPSLVTFLVARSGRARMAFIKWSFENKGLEWVTWLFRGLRFTEKEMANLKEHLDLPRHSPNATYDPKIVEMFLSLAPEVVERVTAEAAAKAAAEAATKAAAKGRKEGLQKGLEEGRQEGRQEGREEGREEGLMLGKVEHVTRLFMLRIGRALTDEEVQVLRSMVVASAESALDEALFAHQGEALAQWLATNT